VDRLVREAADRLSALGAEVDEISVPVHAVGRAIWTPTLVEGLVDLMMRHDGGGTNQRGVFVSSLATAHGRWRQHADEFSISLKVVLLAAEFIRRQYGSHFYGKSQNLIRRMRDEYDRAFERYDLLLMPTTPQKPPRLPPPDALPEEAYAVALNMNRNTSPFCATGHPSITVPCGASDGLPVGLMLTGRLHEDALVYRAAYAFEAS
jgi:amidase